MKIERVIFGNLLNREEYGRKAIPFIKAEYFHDKNDRIIFELIDDYVQKYNRFPTKESLQIDLENKQGVNDTMFKEIAEEIATIETDSATELEWILEKTEKFCQEKAVYNAIMQSIQILDKKDTKYDKGAIPQILSDALGVSFDTHIGHNWMDDSDSRFESYHLKENKIPFRLEYFNLITKGGLPNKTLTTILAGTGIGKSLAMCDFAAGNLLDSKNVLYITMEMAEEKIAERIDANLLDIPLDQMEDISKEVYDKKLARVKTKTKGRLIIKEYPTSSASSANFRHLLNELKLKKSFVPEIIYIDYLNICASSRIKLSGNVNSYTYIKSIAEEIRGLAVEFNVPIVTATQVNRAGYSSSDVGLENTSESFGLPATVDLMFALISSEELEALNQIMVKQLKNRFNDLNFHRKFVVGIDRSRMKLYDVEESAQHDLVDDTPVMNQTKFGSEDDNRSKDNKGFKNKFKGFA